MTDTLKVDSPTPTIWVDPTNNLRWNGGVLEQMFVVHAFDGKTLHGISQEWRPVPTVTPTP